MTNDRIGSGPVAAIVVAALVLLVQVGLLGVALFWEPKALTYLLPPLFAPLVALMQTLVVTPAWSIWLLGHCDPSSVRRRRAIAWSLLLSATTFGVTMWTWYLVYAAPAVHIGTD